MASKRLSIQSTLDAQFLVSAEVRGHQLRIDQPSGAGGQDAAPTPLEIFLFAVGGCIGTIARIMAMQRKIDIRSMQINVHGEYNPAGLLGKPTEDRVGFQRVEIEVQMDCDMSSEEQKAFIDEVCARCPVHENLEHATEVTHSLI